MISKLTPTTSVKKGPKDQIMHNTAAAMQAGSSASSAMPTTPTNLNKKKITNDMIAATLVRMEAQLEMQQAEQNKINTFIVQKLMEPVHQQSGESLQTLSNLITQSLPLPSTPGGGESLYLPSQQQEKLAMKEDFESISNKFVAVLEEMSAEERRDKLAGFIQNLSPNGMDKLAEIVDIFESVDPPHRKRAKKM